MQEQEYIHKYNIDQLFFSYIDTMYHEKYKKASMNEKEVLKRGYLEVIGKLNKEGFKELMRAILKDDKINVYPSPNDVARCMPEEDHFFIDHEKRKSKREEQTRANLKREDDKFGGDIPEEVLKERDANLKAFEACIAGVEDHHIKLGRFYRDNINPDFTVEVLKVIPFYTFCQIKKKGMLKELEGYLNVQEERL